MTLQEAIDAKLPLAIRIDESNDRVMAEAFVIPGGVAWADVFWFMAEGRHPFHILQSDAGAGVSGTGPWRVGTAEIRVIDHGDPKVRELNRWQNYLAGEDAGRSTRALAWQMIQELL